MGQELNLQDFLLMHDGTLISAAFLQIPHHSPPIFGARNHQVLEGAQEINWEVIVSVGETSDPHVGVFVDELVEFDGGVLVSNCDAFELLQIVQHGYHVATRLLLFVFILAGRKGLDCLEVFETVNPDLSIKSGHQNFVAQLRVFSLRGLGVNLDSSHHIDIFVVGNLLLIAVGDEVLHLSSDQIMESNVFVGDQDYLPQIVIVDHSDDFQVFSVLLVLVHLHKVPSFIRQKSDSPLELGHKHLSDRHLWNDDLLLDVVERIPHDDCVLNIEGDETVELFEVVAALDFEVVNGHWIRLQLEVVVVVDFEEVRVAPVNQELL